MRKAQAIAAGLAAGQHVEPNVAAPQHNREEFEAGTADLLGRF
jgi:hypothetical protein